jgi:pilus assembly protein CpaB
MILMVVAVGCGLGASYMTSRLLAERNNRPQAEPNVQVVVAKTRVLAWQAIKEPEKYFEVKQFPQSLAPKNALTDLAALKDQKLKTALDEGKPVSQDDLASKDHRGLEEMLQPGQRAIAVKVNAESLVAGFVLPGSRVDVICTTRGNDAQTSVMLQNMLVLAVDNEIDRTSDKKAIIGQTVTLAATPEEAVRLNLAKSIGELSLMLKSDKDTKRTSNVIARKSDLGKSYTPETREPEPIKASPSPAGTTPLPALPAEPRDEPKPVVKPKPKNHVLTVISGATKERHVFPEGEEDDAAPSSPPPPKKVEPKNVPPGRPPFPGFPPKRP